LIQHGIPVVAFVSSQLETRLRGLIDSVDFPADWNEVVKRCQDVTTMVIIVDPSRIAVEEILGLRSRGDGVVIIPYVALRPQVVPALLKLAAGGVVEVVLANFDDTTAHFARLFDASQGTRLANRFLAEIAEQLAALPRPLAHALIRAIGNPVEFRSVRSLVLVSGCSTRVVFRAIRGVQLKSVRKLLLAGRALRAYALLRDGATSAQDVAQRVGCRSGNQLTKNLVELTGFTASDVKKGVDADEFLRAVVRGVIRPSSQQPRRSGAVHVG